jgi:hypothetical protein
MTDNPYLIAGGEAWGSLDFYIGEADPQLDEDRVFRRNAYRVRDRLDARMAALETETDPAKQRRLQWLISRDITRTLELLPCLDGKLVRWYTKQPHQVINGIGYSWYETAPPEEIVWPLETA